MKISKEQLAKLPPQPKLSRVYLSRKARKTLEDLTTQGLNVPAVGVDGKLRVKFVKEGTIFREPGTGWTQCQIRSTFGARSLVLVDPDGTVSGMVTLTRGKRS